MFDYMDIDNLFLSLEILSAAVWNYDVHVWHIMTEEEANLNSHDGSSCACLSFWWICIVENLLQCFKYCYTISEYSICQQECIKEIDREEP
jgi:hypothetical protein